MLLQFYQFFPFIPSPTCTPQPSSIPSHPIVHVHGLYIVIFLIHCDFALEKGWISLHLGSPFLDPNTLQSAAGQKSTSKKKPNNQAFLALPQVCSIEFYIV